MPLPIQEAATALWRDEAHVEENRALYRRKFDVAERILTGRFGFYRPPGGFLLWLDVGDGEAAARTLVARGGGAHLARRLYRARQRARRKSRPALHPRRAGA